MIRVLVVDDSESTRQALRMRLSLETDIDVVGEAADGACAIARARELAPDVIVMDVGLPGVNGLEATRAIKSALPRVAVVMLTMYADKKKVQAAREVGASALREKGGDGGTLVETIRWAVGAD